jgi:hypothetical protein
LKNSTLAMPSGSDALAASTTDAGAVKVAPLPGDVSSTVGEVGAVVEEPTLTILATDGTPLLSTTVSMYMPGGAMFALRGPVTVRPPLLFWAKLSGT